MKKTLFLIPLFQASLFGGLCNAQSAIVPTPPLSTTATVTANVSCNGGANGTAVASPSGGQTPYTYAWAPSGGSNATATGLSAGTYTVVVVDANVSSATASVVITQPNTLFAFGHRISNVTCTGADNGIASANLSGGTSPYSYSWSPAGGSSDTATGLSAGTYTVTVTDSCGSSVTATVNIRTPNPLGATGHQISGVSCYGGNDASADAHVHNGTAPYTYSWSPVGGSTDIATGLSAGSYTVTVTDSCGSQATGVVVVTQPAELNATSVSTDDNGSTNGTATANSTGGTAPYTYAWSPDGATTATATGLSAGTYTCTVTDNNGCLTTTSVSVNSSAGINSISSASKQITLWPNPNNGKFNIQIDNGQSTINNGTPRLEIYNELGKQIFLQLSIVNFPLSIDLSSQPDGIYLYRVLSDNGNLLGDGKLIIQR